MKRRSLLTACRTALGRAFAEACPGTPLDSKGYVADASQNLISGILLEHFETDLRQGDGRELEGKFRAVHSSSALAVNSFARFSECPMELHLPVGSAFSGLRFEQKCPHGVKSNFKPPNLDMLVESPSKVVAVESKCLEYLSPKKAKFSPAYDADIKDRRRNSGWFREMERLRREPDAYSCLDAAQLIKHAFGVAYTFPNRPATLLYIYWEPANAEANGIFEKHRSEIGQFASAVVGGEPEFSAISYNDLWKLWEKRGQPSWLQSHISNLRERYSVTV